jgi:DNA mismatch repair protein MutL
MPSIDFNTESSMDFPVFRNDRPLISPEITFDHTYNPFTEEQKQARATFRGDEENLRHWETLYTQKPSHSEEQQVLPVENSAHNDSLIQLKNRFILTPVKSGLMMIDQKRAHERILYEQYLRSFAMNYPLAQRTLFPETIELDQADYIVLREIMEDLHTIGFDVRDFGSNTVVLAGYPADSSFENARELLEVFLEQFKSTASDIKVNVRERISRSMAIAGSVGYGETLSRDSMQELVDALFACESPGYSPSGKPIVVILEMEEIEKRFK